MGLFDFNNGLSGLLGSYRNGPMGQGGNDPGMGGAPIDAMGGVNAAMQQNAAQPVHRSFFDKLSHALNDPGVQASLAASGAYAQGNPAAAGQILAHQSDAETERAMYEKRRQDEMADWQAKQQWDREHPKPVNNDSAQDWAFYQQNLSPEEFEKWKVNRVVDPPRYVPLPNGQVLPIGGYRDQSGATSGPPSAAMDHLRRNPALANDFDAKYGAGSAARVLGNGGSSPSGSGMFP